MYAPEHDFDTLYGFPGAFPETLWHSRDRADAQIAAGRRRKRHATAPGTGGEDPAGHDPPRGLGAHVRPSARDPSTRPYNAPGELCASPGARWAARGLRRRP